MTEANNRVTTKLEPNARRVAYAAAGSKAGRPVLQCVRIADNKIQAADGFILAESPIKTEGDGEVLIRADVLAKVKSSKALDGMVVVSSNGKVTIMSDITVETHPVEGSYPKFELLYPKQEPVFKIAFGGKLLAKMAKIAGDNIIKLTFYGTEHPCKFESADITGLLMPVHLGE